MKKRKEGRQIGGGRRTKKRVKKEKKIEKRKQERRKQPAVLPLCHCCTQRV
jgi:hypothetical protein